VAALAANLLVLIDVSLTYTALSDPDLPVAEGDPVTASLIGALGLAGGLALDAAVRILIFTSLLWYVYRRALTHPRVVPLYWGAVAALIVINGAVVLNNLFVLWRPLPTLSGGRPREVPGRGLVGYALL